MGKRNLANSASGRQEKSPQRIFAAFAGIRVAFAFLLLLAAGGCRAQGPVGPRAIAGPPGPVPAEYFGMHVHRLLEGTAWPDVGFATLRLWDTGTTWKDLEPARGQYRFEKLDRLVALAASRHVRILLTFGKTPDWASRFPEGGRFPRETGATSSMQDWSDFVGTVAARYKGRIEGYEIWNEPNWKGFYNDTVEQMVEMTRVASRAIRKADPGALVVSPSATTNDGIPWLKQFLGMGGGELVDVIAYHLYTTPAPPERIPELASDVRAAMAAAHIDKPLWDTETSWTAPRQFSNDEEQAAFAARTMVLGWASGAVRLYWYAWDNRNWVTVNMTRNDNNHSTPAAAAYDKVRNWMTGRRLEGCVVDANETWSCRLTAPGEESFIYWNPQRSAAFSPQSVIATTPQSDSCVSRAGSGSSGIPAATVFPQRVLFRVSDDVHLGAGKTMEIEKRMRLAKAPGKIEATR